MTEEVKVPEVEIEVIPSEETSTESKKVEAEQVAVTTTVNKFDDQARQQGWVPKEEWQGDPEDWTDSKEFVRRGELFSKISSQSSEIKEMKKAMTALVEHHQKVKETEFTRAISYLKQQKKAALEEGNADKLLEVEDAMDALKQEQSESKKEKQAPAEKQLSPAFVQWVRNNQWYANDKEMQAFADDIGVGYYSRHPGAPEQDVYQYVQERVKRAYPEKFKGQGTKIPTVESGNTGSNGGTKKETVKLSEEQDKVMKTFIRQGIMTKEQYIEDLRKIGAI